MNAEKKWNTGIDVTIIEHTLRLRAPSISNWSTESFAISFLHIAQLASSYFQGF